MDLTSLQPGGLVWFAGGLNPFKAGVGGALLSRLIEVVTGSKFSHVGIVLPAQYWFTPTVPRLVESTIWNHTSGPQTNNLVNRLHLDYASKGGHAWFRSFLPPFVPDWDSLWKQAQEMFGLVSAGKLHYSVKRLFGDAAARNWLFAALPVAGILEHLSEDDRGVVCSECAALLLQAGLVDAKAKSEDVPWLPKVKPVAGQPIGCAPEDLWEMPIWQPAVTLL